MTESEFVDRYHHEIGGMVLDAFRHGSQEPKLQSRFQADIMNRVDAILKQGYAELCPPTPPEPVDLTPLPVKVDLPKEAPKPPPPAPKPLPPAKQPQTGVI